MLSLNGYEPDQPAVEGESQWEQQAENVLQVWLSKEQLLSMALGAAAYPGVGDKAWKVSVLLTTCAL